MKIMNSVFVVDNLSTSAFLNASWKVVKLSLEILWDRPSGITFFQFDFRIETNHEDARIERDPSCFQFSLQLPQQHYNAITNKVEDISSSEKMKSQHSARKQEESPQFLEEYRSCFLRQLKQ